MNITHVIQSIDQLSREEIQQRLKQIESEEKQLRALLRLSRHSEAKRVKQTEAASCD